MRKVEPSIKRFSAHMVIPSQFRLLPTLSCSESRITMRTTHCFKSLYKYGICEFDVDQDRRWEAHFRLSRQHQTLEVHVPCRQMASAIAEPMESGDRLRLSWRSRSD